MKDNNFFNLPLKVLNAGLFYYVFVISGDLQLPAAVSSRIMLSAWWVFCLVIVSTFSANLIAFLAIDIYKIPFKNLYEVLFQTEFQYGILGGTAWMSMFQVKSLLLTPFHTLFLHIRYVAVDLPLASSCLSQSHLLSY